MFHWKPSKICLTRKYHICPFIRQHQVRFIWILLELLKGDLKTVSEQVCVSGIWNVYFWIILLIRKIEYLEFTDVSSHSWISKRNILPSFCANFLQFGNAIGLINISSFHVHSDIENKPPAPDFKEKSFPKFYF